VCSPGSLQDSIRTSLSGRRPGRPRGQSDFLEPEELKRLVGLPDRRTKDGLRDYAVLVLLANTPLRKAEICSLRRGNLVERGGRSWIEYRILKKRKIRQQDRWKEKTAHGIIPLRPEVAAAITGYHRSEFRRESDNPDNPLFMTLGKHGLADKKGITARAVDLIVAKYARASGIMKRITPHSFRASYATHALASGMDIKTVSLLLGHESAASTEPYLRSNLERMSRAADFFCFV
jgi:integrase